MKLIWLVLAIGTSLMVSACSLLVTERETFVITGQVISSDPFQPIGDHFYIHGFKESSSRKNDRFEFTEIIEINSSGYFSFSYETTLSNNQARKTGKNYIIISGEPLIENPEVLAWNKNYDDVILTLKFN